MSFPSALTTKSMRIATYLGQGLIDLISDIENDTFIGW
jgi:hypothetical protein